VTKDGLDVNACCGFVEGHNGRIDAYTRVDMTNGAIVQLGACPACGAIVARRYTTTGPGTGPWTTLGMHV
jgi:hypothetical protein